MSTLLQKLSFGAGAIFLALFLAVTFFTPARTDVARSETSCPNAPQVPVLNPYPVTYTDPPEVCKDSPVIMGRLINGVYPRSQQELENGLTARSGDELYILEYVHNGAASNLDPNQSMARNVQVTTRVNNSESGNHTIEVTVTGNNTNTLHGIYKIKTEAGERLEVVTGSGEEYNYLSQLQKSGLAFGNSTYTIGDLRACFEYSKLYRFKVRVVRGVVNPPPPAPNPPSPTPTPPAPVQTPVRTTLSVLKEVKIGTSDYANVPTATIKPGERIEYQIKVKNTGTTNAVNVRLRDDLGYYLQNLTLIDASKSYTGTFGDTKVITFSSLNPGEEIIVHASAVAYTALSTAYKACNLAIASADNATGVTSKVCADIITQQSPPPSQNPPPPPAPPAQPVPPPAAPNPPPAGQVQGATVVLSKQVYNDTQNKEGTTAIAHRGDILTYTLTVNNAGSATSVGYTIQDDLSGVLPLADMVSAGPGWFNGQILIFPNQDISPGQSISQSFKVQIKSNLPGYQYVLSNTFGNTTRVTIGAVTTSAVYVAPKTGGGSPLANAFGLASVSTFGFGLLKNRRLRTLIFS